MSNLGMVNVCVETAPDLGLGIQLPIYWCQVPLKSPSSVWLCCGGLCSPPWGNAIWETQLGSKGCVYRGRDAYKARHEPKENL